MFALGLDLSISNWSQARENRGEGNL